LSLSNTKNKFEGTGANLQSCSQDTHPFLLNIMLRSSPARSRKKGHSPFVATGNGG